MKKIMIYTVALLSMISLVACKNQKTQTTTVKGIYAKEKQLIMERFDAKNVSINVEKNVKDSDFPKGYNNIKVSLIGDKKVALSKAMKVAKKSLATKEEYNQIYEIRKETADLAKTLPNQKTAITVGFEKSKGDFEVIAKSSQGRNLIPVGKPAK
ncbi:hypothetical protein QYR58_06780 [Streptococcus iniae]|uniref:hypothetical protein n=1 Tax=Streptococcus iniae TaxID=1346 RepID=UPI002B321D41|nr:hypothetical protein QYR55_07300 [Streptococcus iniae]WNZ89511.1 hypothetical protein QYR57_07015 [Streptococcus iniae]WNZ91144.1 hypothetical protein QYR59_07305 [Streptococcus iniae]WNZ92648.1 hypothetical protein QYR58_06780 [Streptococcus iniae]WNZ95275.1 hypothetical protein QYR54_05165 [Streptococcus iniae]